MFKFFIIASVLVSASFAEVDYDSCADSLCFGALPDCVATKDCDIVTRITKEGENFRFEVTADYKGEDITNKWVGVALGLDGGRGMGNDAAVACYYGLDGSNNVRNYWNDLEPFFSYPVADAQGGLSETVLEKDGSKLSCSFVRQAVTQIITPNEPVETVTIDLNTIPYYIMIATGPLNEETGNIARHTKQLLTANPINFPDIP